MGIEFLDEVNRAIEMVRDAPTTWPFYDANRGLRRYLVHRFPYGLIYRTRDTTIQVIAVMHLRRHPGYWQGRGGYWNNRDRGQPTTASNATS